MEMEGEGLGMAARAGEGWGMAAREGVSWGMAAREGEGLGTAAREGVGWGMAAMVAGASALPPQVGLWPSSSPADQPADSNRCWE